MEKQSRYAILDSIRGFVLINMIVYHALWDIVYLFHVDLSWYKSGIGFVWQQAICCTFILLSGFCFTLGKKKFQRAVQILIFSIIISAVTAFLMPRSRILFGVLTLIGSCMLIMILLEKALKYLNSYVGLILFLGLFIFTRNINYGVIGIFDVDIFTIPTAWYVNLFTAFWGFPPQSFVLSDYFSFIPWLFLYVCGYFLYRVFEKRNLMRFLYLPRFKILEWFGRNSLSIYMLHQPLVYAILLLLIGN